MTKIKIPSEYRCLVVEDNEARNQIFRQWLPDAVITTSPTAAIEALKTQKFDVVFLDHDCHGMMFVDTSDPEYLNRTFWRVAQELHRQEYTGNVIVHSGNPVGAKRMALLLAETDACVSVFPFGSFSVEVINEGLEEQTQAEGRV